MAALQRKTIGSRKMTAGSKRETCWWIAAGIYSRNISSGMAAYLAGLRRQAALNGASQ